MRESGQALLERGVMQRPWLEGNKRRVWKEVTAGRFLMKWLTEKGTIWLRRRHLLNSVFKQAREALYPGRGVTLGRRRAGQRCRNRRMGELGPGDQESRDYCFLQGFG